MPPPPSYSNMMQQFAQFPFEVEPDDGDEEEEGMWEGGDAGAGGQLPRSMVYQRTSASWRPKHCSTSSRQTTPNSTTSGSNAMAYYTDDGSSSIVSNGESNSSSVQSSRVPSARSTSLSNRHRTRDADVSFAETLHHRQEDGLRADFDGDEQEQAVLKSPPASRPVPTVKRHNLLPTRSALAAVVQARARSTSPVNLRHQRHVQRETHQIAAASAAGHDLNTFRRLVAGNACSLSGADLDKVLFDAGLGDGMLSARRGNEGSVKRGDARAINLTIRLSSDYDTLKKLGCSEGVLQALHGIDPPKQQVEIVAEKVETGDMTLLCASPDDQLQPIAARHFLRKRRQGSPVAAPLDHNIEAVSHASLVRQQAARRADSGSPSPPLQDWRVEAQRSPLKFPAMASPVPRFEQAQRSLAQPLRDGAPGLVDWSSALQASNYTYRSIFTGPPRMAEVKRDVVTPPPQQATSQPHDRRSCTAQHKHEREPNSMLEARIAAALAKEAQAPTTTERMGLKSVLERAAALEVDHIGSHYGPSDHERIRSKQDRLMEVA